jgi:molybdate transport system substrate-binding protein
MRYACLRRAVLAGLSAVVLVAAPMRAAADEVLVFAAASLTNALDRVAEAWSAETGHTAVIAYAGSSALARQIQEGAPADIFISANTDWMDEIGATGDLREGTRRDLLSNRLVLIAHGRDAEPVRIDEDLDLVSMLGGERLSMALVEAVPAGVYGRAALTSLGLWDSVAPMVAQSYSVRTALAFVALGEAPLGIVYATDAAVEDNVTVIGTFPSGSHPPIILPAAITAQSESPVAADFLDFLGSGTAREIWTEFGFGAID